MHEAEAGQHGEQRWESGWSITELVRDYQILRLVVLDYLEQVVKRPLRARETMAIGVFIDDAIAASIGAYVRHRDEAVASAERERAATMEEASHRKDEFLAMLGHELRNPLAPILTAVRIIESAPASDPRTLRSATEVIARQSRHLVRLVDDILDVARIGRGRLELRKERIDIATAVHQAVEEVEPLLKARDQLLTVALPNASMCVDADLSRLVQIVSNLLNNASKYTEPAGHIWLTARREDGHASIRVRDNGMGIPGDMLACVFDLFTQVGGAQPYASGGLGIGLTLVRRLVEQHGGTVTCESEGRGKGSQFTVLLPLAKADVDSTLSPLPKPTTLRVEPLPKRAPEK
jgi:signal transduction histidine kinase